MHTLEAEKSRLRAQFRAIRDGQIPAVRTAHDAKILANLQAMPELSSAVTIFCYISTGSEVDTRKLIDGFKHEGKRVLVPTSGPDGRLTACLFNSWKDITAGRFAIPEPRPSMPYAGKIDVCITPGLAFTARGQRLGQGFGYYDRWFASHAVRRIALAYECQLTDQLPVTDTDTPVNMIVTERRIIRVS